MKLPNWIVSGSAVLLCASCALLDSPAERARAMAASGGMEPVAVPDSRLRAFARPAVGNNGATLATIYIESDGARWRTPDQPPTDPTPQKPMVLNMAITDPTVAVAYLGRPCQHLEASELAGCDPTLWMRGRFSEEVVATMNRAVGTLKTHFGARRVNLVGYSGGGAVAALIAARRTDVNCLVTIAAPLDTRAWTAKLEVSELNASLNPADQADKLKGIAQTHFRGGQDRIVPPPTTVRFMNQQSTPAVIDQHEFDHECCWEGQWATLRRLSCLAE